MTGPWGWRAQVTDDWYGGIDNVRVQFARPHGPTELEYLVGFEDGAGNGTARPVFAVELVAATPEFRGFLIPREAVEALAEQVKPGPSQGEVKRLEEALAHERDRSAWLSNELVTLAERPPAIIDVDGRLTPMDVEQIRAEWGRIGVDVHHDSSSAPDLEAEKVCTCIRTGTLDDPGLTIGGDVPCPAHGK
jgi:hypothetical protein